MTLSHPKPSLLLSELASHSEGGVDILAALEASELRCLLDVSSPLKAAAGAPVFHQGDRHEGIFIIRSGQVRIFYSGPSGREITLAYWSPGNFVGGPEIFGGGQHMWSGQAVRPTELLHIRGSELRKLVSQIPRLAVVLLEATVHKGKCFSALIQMLGTRSAAQRLAQLLVLMGEFEGRKQAEGIVISRTLTQEDLAKLVGSTRQWVSSSLERFREDGVVEVSATRILIRDEIRLRIMAG